MEFSEPNLSFCFEDEVDFLGKDGKGCQQKWCVFFTCEWLAGDFPYEMVRYI